MGFYLKKDGTYYEGDNQGGDQEVTRRPSRFHTWQNSAWVEDVPARLEDDVLRQIAALEAQFTTTMQMRVSLGDQAAIAETSTLLSQIDALKAQLVP